MNGSLPAEVAPFEKTIVPLRTADLPSRTCSRSSVTFVVSLMFAFMLLMYVTGCAGIEQDASTDARQAASTDARQAAQTPVMSAASETPELASPPAAPSNEPVYLTSETTASMNLPFSDAVRVGHLLFLSGQIGNIPGTTDLAPGGIQGEARQIMENIKAVLEANGSSMDRVFKATVMLADIAEWPAFNEVYVTYFPGDKPARSAFAGSGLAFGARCEVEVIATVGE